MKDAVPNLRMILSMWFEMRERAENLVIRDLV